MAALTAFGARLEYGRRFEWIRNGDIEWSSAVSGRLGNEKFLIGFSNCSLVDQGDTVARKTSRIFQPAQFSVCHHFGFPSTVAGISTAQCRKLSKSLQVLACMLCKHTRGRLLRCDPVLSHRGAEPFVGVRLTAKGLIPAQAANPYEFFFSRQNRARVLVRHLYQECLK